MKAIDYMHYNLSPRKIFPWMSFNNLNDSLPFTYAYSLHLYLIDTAQEKKINVGKEYAFDPLGKGECIINWE